MVKAKKTYKGGGKMYEEGGKVYDRAVGRAGARKRRKEVRKASRVKDGVVAQGATRKDVRMEKRQDRVRAKKKS